MEGRGVINYAPGTPSYAFSTDTTEFDDALMSKGIVSFEQVMIAKGASPEEGHRLAEIYEASIRDVSSAGMNQCNEHEVNNTKELGDGYDDDDDDEESDGTHPDEDNFLNDYRRKRMDEMKNGTRQEYGDVIPISKPDWNREVNEASKSGLWVIVCLSRCSASLSHTHDAICDKVESITRDLADKFVNIKFVSIPSTSAIEHWPPEQLPTLFCYRHGKLQHQLIGIDSMGGLGVNAGRLEWRLAILGVLQTELEEDPRPSQIGEIYQRSFEAVRSCTPASRLYDSDDFDDVD